MTEWSYIPPIPELEACEAQIRPDSTISVQSAEGGRQRIAVTSSPGGDEVNSSRYLATQDVIEPISHQMYFGPLVALIAAAASGFSGSIVGAFGVRLYRRSRATA
jgi:hypothetical protein